MDRPKVFGIGFNRTGTSSLKLALRQLGYKVLGKNQPFVKLYRQGKVDAIIEQTAGWDGFQDWPWPMLYKELLEHFDEDARFILTRRSTPEKWVESLKRHSERTNPKSNQRKLMLGYDYPHGLETEHVRLYQEHLDAVRTHFRECGKVQLLAEFCWEDGDGWRELCGFLGHEIPNTFPKANASNKASKGKKEREENLRRIERQRQRLEKARGSG